MGNGVQMGGLERIKNLSLRKTLVLYIVCFLLFGIALSSLTINYADDRQNSIWEKYSKSENMGEESDNNIGMGASNYINGDLQEEVNMIYVYPRVSSSVLTAQENIIVESCDFLQTWSIFIYSAGCVLGAVLLFYKNKIKTPLHLLDKGAKEIVNNNLDFTIHYDKRDEMGQLCDSFEKMREQLQQNNSKMWRMMEEQKRVNAAFAHDLRTPLTVLRGYSNLLLRYVPEGKIEEEKLLSTIGMMSRQISRLEGFTDSMKQVTSLEDIKAKHETVSTKILIQTITDSAEILAENAEKQIEITTKARLADCLQLDTKIVLEVTENLLNNAVRYAKATVHIELAQVEKFFVVTIRDDGKGFYSDYLIDGIKPYSKDKLEEKVGHFGLGLYISSILCEKHGGKLVLTNSENGGAKVEAKFLLL